MMDYINLATNKSEEIGRNTEELIELLDRITLGGERP